MDIIRKTEERKGSVSQNASLGDMNERSKAGSDSSKISKNYDKDGAGKQRTSQRQKKPTSIEDLGYFEREKKFKVIRPT